MMADGGSGVHELAKNANPMEDRCAPLLYDSLSLCWRSAPPAFCVVVEGNFVGARRVQNKMRIGCTSEKRQSKCNRRTREF